MFRMTAVGCAYILWLQEQLGWRRHDAAVTRGQFFDEVDQDTLAKEVSEDELAMPHHDIVRISLPELVLLHQSTCERIIITTILLLSVHALDPNMRGKIYKNKDCLLGPSCFRLLETTDVW